MGVCRFHVCAAVCALPYTAYLGAAVARLVKDVFESAAGIDAVGAVSDYLRSQRVTSLPDLQVYLNQARLMALLLSLWCFLSLWLVLSISICQTLPTFRW